ncbi:phosphoenolpyruvate synthase [Sporomusa sphaeroides]|uniref:Phosphoenolpyruvate synthase n=1 Tax=Sporomusa sphaeroides DSM 2875 TaxID=1337886 RepID=A0ABM9W2U7_9FIRM|nr:phosphoenolpyruvate synthase [Sporomusa sphaeroides]OLS55646.1 phosphoenolpyruvate synthase [Sporomusa sphaeroides DSM 2875]CVK19428.1 Phosphoenolpyruvate synthase [Sporomusa sphaeroides DSM 2875]
MQQYVIFFNQINRSSLPLVGGKGANLGEMTQAGFPVPSGFCVTTLAYRDFVATSSAMEAFFAKLSNIDTSDLHQVREIGQGIREHLQQVAIPGKITAEILHAWEKTGTENYYAVRSSATAEDLPNASFAGQQDTYLNIKGQEELLTHVRKCWASLFTDRAIVYRTKNGFDHREVYLSIVIQQMVIPEVSGIMFTADPVNGNRTVVSIDASFGLGEALVSGLVTADLYKVKDHVILNKKIARKKLAIYAVPEGGTVTQELPAAQQEQQVLTDSQIIDMAGLGKKIEKHYGQPQDIEFCVAQNECYIVQSRPITTLYPLPDMPQQPVRVMLSFGHAQMMTDAFKPLGLSVLQNMVSQRLFKAAGGRIFLDLSDILHNKLARLIFPKVLSNADEAMSRAIDVVIKRPEFLKGRQLREADAVNASTVGKILMPVMKQVWIILRSGDPKAGREHVDKFMQQHMAQTRQALCGVQGAERIKAVKKQCDSIFTELIPNIGPYLLAGLLANVLLKKICIRKFGNQTEVDLLNKSLPGNVTSEMGLALGDLADKVRDLPDVQEYLKVAEDQSFFSRLDEVPGGRQCKAEFAAFIDKYGMRCPGEIDITTPRWYETPTRLTSAIFSNIQSLKPGEHRERFARGEKEAAEAARRILQAETGRLTSKPVSRLINVYRNLGGLREHHKFLLISVMGECKQAILAEARQMAATGILEQAEDSYYLTLDELYQLLQGNMAKPVTELVARRKAQYQRYQELKPPRVMTSEGEIVVVPPRRDHIPLGALLGSPVSAGVAEGIARVILRPEEAVLKAGEILVAPHTDPGWTPLFQSAIAIVTEVGGLMTHGAVVAREYGIPAVVGVDEATTLIKNGERIRVDGTQGLIEFLSTPNE